MNVKAITKADIPHAAQVLTTAFRHDPIFRYIFGTEDLYRQRAPWLFGTWVRWSVMFGRAWMTADGSAVVLMRDIRNPRMSLWSMIRAGMLPTPRKLGWAAFRRFYFDVVALLDRKHTCVMGGMPHWYGWMIGADTPGNGAGRALLQHCFRIADEAGLPVFLETATVENVALYHAKEFEVRDEARVSDSCTIYFMVRPPQPPVISSTLNEQHEARVVYP